MSLLKEVLAQHKAKRVAKPSNLNKFAQIQKQRELAAHARTAQATAAPAQHGRLEVLNAELLLNGQVIPKEISVANVRKYVHIPESFAGKMEMFKGQHNISALSWMIQGILYVDMCKQDANAPTLMLQHCPNVDLAYLHTLQAVGEGRIHPQLLMSHKPLFRQLLAQKAPIGVQETVANTKAVWVPIVLNAGHKGQALEVVMRRRAPNEVSAWSAGIIVKEDGTLEQNHATCIALAKEAIKAKDVQAQTPWEFKLGSLWIGNLEFPPARFHTMALAFYTYVHDAEALNFFKLRGASALENTFKKNQIATK